MTRPRVATAPTARDSSAGAADARAMRIAGLAFVAAAAVATGIVLVAMRATRDRVVAVRIGPSLLPASIAERPPLSEAARRAADVALHERRVREDPSSAADWSFLAAHRLQAARDAQDPALYRAAEGDARRSIALRSDRNAKTMMLLASSLLAQHRFTEALAWSDSTLARDPYPVSFRALHLELLVELGRYAEAAREARGLAGERLHPAVAPRLARWHELTGHPDSARSLLVSARAIADTARDLPAEQRAWFHLRIADFLLRAGRLDEARAAITRGRELAPADLRLAFASVRHAALAGDAARALALGDSLGDAIDIATAGVLASAADAAGEARVRDRWLAHIEASNRANPEPYARGWTLARLEHARDVRATRALLEREIAARPDVYGWDQLALARAATGDVSGARAASRAARELGTRDAALVWHAAVVELAAGDTARARALAGDALAMNAAFHPRDAARARALVSRSR